jgi:ribosomal 30S subunit maturation factor RimM
MFKSLDIQKDMEVVGLDGKRVGTVDHLETADRNAVKSVEGQTVTATYKGGEKKIDIPANVPIVAVVPADKGDITPGAIVFVPTEKQADGTLVSGAVLFGKDGVIPPM